MNEPIASTEEQTVSPERLAILLAIAQHFEDFEEKNKTHREKLLKLAISLDESGTIYYPYAIVDGLSVSYSMFKYFCDVFLSAHGDTAQHDMLSSPGGIAAVVAESLFLISFSFLSCHFDKEEADERKKMVATLWPYVRDVLKGFKNCYKGLGGTLKIGMKLGLHNAMPILIPLSLSVGLIAAANRVWIRYMRKVRKDLMKANKDNLIEVNELKAISYTEVQQYIDKYRLADLHKKYYKLTAYNMAYIVVVENALIDSFYLYMGLITLASVSNIVLWPLLILSIAYSLCCLAVRWHEEYGYQQKLLRTEIDYEIAIYKKALLTEQKKLSELKSANVHPEVIQAQKEKVESLLSQLHGNYQTLQRMSENSYLMAALTGLRHGLFAYGMAASLTFVIASFLWLASVACPPALMVAVVLSGLLMLSGFVAHALITEYAHQHKKEKKTASNTNLKKTLEQHMKDMNQAHQTMNAKEFAQMLEEGFFLDPSPQFFFQEWFEVIRSFFSGVGKGQRNIDFTFNHLQEPDEQGNYHDTPIMFALMAVNALVFGVTLAVRALAKNLGRNVPADSDKSKTEKVQEILSEVTHKPSDMHHTKTPETPVENQKRLTHSSESLSSLSFFSKPPASGKQDVYYEDDRSSPALPERRIDHSEFAGLLFRGC